MRCATTIVEAARALAQGPLWRSYGRDRDEEEDIGGIAVHIAARIAALAEGGQVLVSRTVRDLVAGSNLRLEERGAYALKG